MLHTRFWGPSYSRLEFYISKPIFPFGAGSPSGTEGESPMESLNKMDMGKRIKEIRKKARLRQWQLAEILGTTQSAVHKYEHGVIPEPRRLVKLARLGHTTLEWILTGQHWENGSEGQERMQPDTYKLAERLQSLGPEQRRTLDDALRIVTEALEVMRTAQGNHKPLDVGGLAGRLGRVPG